MAARTGSASCLGMASRARAFRVLMPAFAVLMLTVAGLAFWAQRLVGEAGRDRLYDDVNAVPARTVGLVLGTSPLAGTAGRTNQYFVARIEAAAALYHAGKVRKLILSGNGVEPDYHEPDD